MPSSVRPLAVSVVAAAAFAFADVGRAEERVCVEEVADVCLKYELRASPSPSPAANAEAALGLDRGARRQVQRKLAGAGHYSGAIDGVFGRGTRAAIRNWQASRGKISTGYLTSEDIAVLSSSRPSETPASQDKGFYQGKPVVAIGVPDGSAYDLSPDQWLRFDRPSGYCTVWKSRNSEIEYKGETGFTYMRARSTDLRVRITRIKKGEFVWGYRCS